VLEPAWHRRRYVCRILRVPRLTIVGSRRSARNRRGAAGVFAAVAAGAVIVGAGVGLLVAGIVNLRSSSSATLRTATLLERVITVERSVVDAETGLRGYVITVDPVFLTPLRAAARALPGEASELLAAARRDHEHVAAARKLGSSAQGYMVGYVDRVLTLMQSDRAAARSDSETLAGKQRVDAVRSLTARLEGALTAQQDALERNANTVANRDIAFGIAALVLLVLLTAAIEGGLGRLLLARGRALARSAGDARMLQTSLLPLAIPEIPNCDLAIRFTPAGSGDLVGGDFYDVFPLDTPGHWAVVVGDVCGKGAEAAATTAVARWTLRSASLMTPSPATALRHLNEVMRRRQQRFLFATITYLLLDIRPDEMRVTIACAGHPPPIVLASNPPAATAATAHGDLVGIWPRLRLETAEVRLAPGDLIVAYTDGATDFSADPLDPLEMFVGGLEQRDAGSVAAAIEARALSGQAAPRDDIAVVAIGFRGADAGENRSKHAGQDPAPAVAP
jgi:sigma-B regulation protein RsbU (phosphoserine phosphatase)